MLWSHLHHHIWMWIHRQCPLFWLEQRENEYCKFKLSWKDCWVLCSKTFISENSHKRIRGLWLVELTVDPRPKVWLIDLFKDQSVKNQINRQRNNQVSWTIFMKKLVSPTSGITKLTHLNPNTPQTRFCKKRSLFDYFI